MMKYLYVDTHAGVLANGNRIANGEIVELTKKEEERSHNQALIADNKLRLVAEKRKQTIKNYLMKGTIQNSEI